MCYTTVGLDLFDGFVLVHPFGDKEEALWKEPCTVQIQSEHML